MTDADLDAAGLGTPDLEVGAEGVRIYGVRYSFAFFAAMARRLGAGTQVEVFRRDDGRTEFYTHKPAR